MEVQCDLLNLFVEAPRCECLFYGRPRRAAPTQTGGEWIVVNNKPYKLCCLIERSFTLICQNFCGHLDWWTEEHPERDVSQQQEQGNRDEVAVEWMDKLLLPFPFLRDEFLEIWINTSAGTVCEFP